jgi:hypothetical protein
MPPEKAALSDQTRSFAFHCSSAVAYVTANRLLQP